MEYDPKDNHFQKYFKKYLYLFQELILSLPKLEAISILNIYTPLNIYIPYIFHPFSQRFQMNSQTLEKDSSSNNSANKSQELQLTKKQLVIELVKEWHQNFNVQKIDYSQCFETFVNHYSQASKLKIRFDNQVSRYLAQISKEIEFLQFSEDQQNELKKTLEFINEILRQKNFISERQYNQFKNDFLANNLNDSIYLLENNLRDAGYIKKKDEQQPKKKVQKDMPKEEKQILLKLWDISMMPSLEVFWKFIIKEKIQDRKIFVVFKIYETLLEEQVSRQFRREVTLYIKDTYDRKRHAKVTPIHELNTSMVAYDHILNQKAEIISVYLNKQRWKKYQKQYELLTQFLLKRCNKKQIRFEPYGSFQSKFYIVKYSDIDIGLYHQSLDLNHRQKVCKTLAKICDAINADKAHLTYCIYAKAFKQEKIKVPFVKVVYNSSFGKNKDIVPSMDIIINNYDGLENSKMLALYAQDEYVLKFCNLIKYWAVNRNLINMQRKMQGLSSYGLLLMCLYYLMATKQIPFLKRFNKQYDIGRTDFNITHNFLDNFIGFLKFYAYEYTDYQTKETKKGLFHKGKQMVCLIETNEGKKLYDQYLIINMYDFIDGTNPGRMKTHLYSKFENIFNETLLCLEERSLSFLEIVYHEDCQDQNQDRVMKFAKRGNRYPTVV